MTFTELVVCHKTLNRQLPSCIFGEIIKDTLVYHFAMAAILCLHLKVYTSALLIKSVHVYCICV